MKPKSAHRYRICGTPVRTGCITCKIRRVKCGEEKPYCKRCTSTGRTCDGYAPIDQKTTQARRPLLKVSLSENSDDHLERKLFHFFSSVTAPTLSGHFSKDFWERRVLQASLIEPSIRHATIALGAVHHDFISKHESNSKPRNPSIKPFAFRQYTKAISHLHRLMSTQTQQLDFTLISCILFICFDFIAGNHDSAIIHLKAGLQILEEVKKRNAEAISHSQALYSLEWEREFAPLLLGLGVQAASFVNAKHRKDRASLWAMLKVARVPAHPTTFHSIDEARHSLESTIVDVMADKTTTEDHISEGNPHYSPGWDGLWHIAAMESWMKSLDHYLGTCIANESASIKLQLAASILKVHWLVIFIVISNPESSNQKFQQIISLCETLIPESDSNRFLTTNFSADIGIICPLFFTALRAPKLFVRQQAISLLSRAPRREGMWDSDDAVLVAGDAIKDEEERGDSLSLAIPEETCDSEIDKWNDISARLKTRFSWPYAQEQKGDNFSTSFVHDFPLTDSDFWGGLPTHSCEREP